LAELDGGSNVVATFVYGEGINVPELMVKGGRTYRLVKDHLGSVRLVVDTGDGTIVQEMRYDAWGNVVLDTNPGFQPFGFAGGLYDPQTRLVRFGARDYDASIGRWMGKDPLLFPELSVAGHANAFAYAGASPTDKTDPSGESILPMGLDCERAGPIIAASHNKVYEMAQGDGPCKRILPKRGLYPCFDDFCNPDGPCMAVITCSPFGDNKNDGGSEAPMRGPCKSRIRINSHAHGRDSQCRARNPRGWPPFAGTMFHEYFHTCGLSHEGHCDSALFYEILTTCEGLPPIEFPAGCGGL
jgi:RHS repeat-associated protein